MHGWTTGPLPRGGLGEDGVLAVVPVHRAAVHDDAAHGGAVASDPLRRRLHLRRSGASELKPFERRN